MFQYDAQAQCAASGNRGVNLIKISPLPPGHTGWRCGDIENGNITRVAMRL